VFTWSRSSAKKVDKYRTPAILNPVMTYFWLIENIIKEYAKSYRDEKTTLDDFFVQLREIVDGELDCVSLEDRIEGYDEDNNWDGNAES